MIQEEVSGTSFDLAVSGRGSEGGGPLQTLLFVGTGPMATGQHGVWQRKASSLLEPV